ncbi:diguanylate cyclase domain-containing protein [Ahniella affigens]|nr:diguanylate cyclase [Ahniella affigens]
MGKEAQAMPSEHSKNIRRVRIGDIEIDWHLRIVRTDTGQSELTPRVFELLAAFIQGPDRLWTRDELFRTIWPGLIVEDANLTQSVWMLRRALGSHAMIRTVARKGYLFAPSAPIEVEFEGQPAATASRTDVAKATRTEQSPELVGKDLIDCDNLLELSIALARHLHPLGLEAARLLIDCPQHGLQVRIPIELSQLAADERALLETAEQLQTPHSLPISAELSKYAHVCSRTELARFSVIGVHAPAANLAPARRMGVAAAMRAHSLLAQQQLQHEVENLTYSAQLQRALFDIAEASSRAQTARDFFAAVHAIVGEFLDARNFYVALLSDDSRTLQFPYYVDEYDSGITERPYGHGMSELVMDMGEPLIADASFTQQLHHSGKAQVIGTRSDCWLGAPLLVKGKAIGVVAVQTYESGQRYRPEDRDVLGFVAVHIANAMERRQVRDELERKVAVRTTELRQEVVERQRGEKLQQALYRIADLASSGDRAQSFYQRLHEVVGSLMYAENFYIARYDIERNVLRMLYFTDTRDSENDWVDREVRGADAPNSVTFNMLKLGAPVRGSSPEILSMLNIRADQVFGTLPEHWLGVPMMDRGIVRGAVVVQSYDPGIHYSEDDQALLVFVAQHIWTALERREAHARLELSVEERTRALRQEIVERQRSERMQRALFEIAEVSMARCNLEEFYRRLHAIIGELIDARNFYVAMINETATLVDFPYCVDEQDGHLPQRPFGRGLTEFVYRTRKPLLATQKDILHLAERDLAISTGTLAACWLGVPLLVEDRVVGVLTVQTYRETESYTAHDLELLSFVAIHVTNALERRQRYTELERRVDERTRELADANRELVEQIAIRRRIELELRRETMHDPLTGLANRNNLLGKLGQLLGQSHALRGAPFALLLLDLDGFKAVNDAVGHLLGDELLKEISLRVANTLRVPGLVARMGGDEFALVVDRTESEAQLQDIARTLLAGINLPIRMAAREWRLTASVGIAIAQGSYRNPEDVLRDADLAMYRAKDAGRNQAVLFTEGMRQSDLA